MSNNKLKKIFTKHCVFWHGESACFALKNEKDVCHFLSFSVNFTNPFMQSENTPLHVFGIERTIHFHQQNCIQLYSCTQILHHKLFTICQKEHLKPTGKKAAH